MRIITGTAKGRQLILLDDETRPLSDRAKSAIFSILQERIPGSSVLDLYAGSGALGIECISRGAIEAVFCDISSSAIESININLKKCEFTEQASVIQMDAGRYVQNHQNEKFDIVFVCPPYREVKFHTIKEAGNLVKDTGILIFEHNKKDKFRNIPGLTKIDSRTYGIVQFDLYIPQTESSI